MAESKTATDEEEERVSRTVLCFCSERARGHEEEILKGLEQRHGLIVKQRAERDLDWEEALQIADRMISDLELSEKKQAKQDEVVPNESPKNSARSNVSKGSKSPPKSARSEKTNQSKPGTARSTFSSKESKEADREEMLEVARREEELALQKKLERAQAQRNAKVESLAKGIFGGHVGAEIVVVSLLGSDAAQVLVQAFQDDEALADLLVPPSSKNDESSAHNDEEKKVSDDEDESKDDEEKSETQPPKAPEFVYARCAACVGLMQEVFFAPPPLHSGLLDFRMCGDKTNAKSSQRKMRSTKSGRVRLEDLLDFVFPADQQHPWSTGRLLVFGEYGPLNSESKLESGLKGEHVVSKHEINTMIGQINTSDMLFIYIQDQLLSPDEVIDVIKQVDPQIRRDKQITREEVIALFENVKVDPADQTMSFHDMQSVVFDFRFARIERWKLMAANSVRKTTTLSKKQRAARVRHEAAVHKASELSLRRAPQIDDIDAFLATSKLLHRHAFEICTLEDKNHPSLVQNVHILRDVESKAVSLGAIPWSPAFR